jgi:hypothetical protein
MDVNSIAESVERARASVLATVAGITERQATFKPSQTDWSIVEIIEHLYLAEMSGVTKIWSAADSFRAGQRWTDTRPNQGKTIEQVVQETWKPKEVAPPIATPHIGGPLCCWRSAYRSLTPVLTELTAALDGLPLEDVIFPHFLSGPLDARQRLEFLRFHMERHIAQIESILDHPSYHA